MAGSFNERAAQSWFAHIAQVPRQAGLDHHAQAVPHLSGSPAPELDIGATQTPEQRAILEGLKALERIKCSATI